MPIPPFRVGIRPLRRSAEEACYKAASSLPLAPGISLPLILSKRSRLNPISGGHRPTLAGSARFSRAVHGFVPTFRIDLHRRAAAVVENSMTSSPTRVRGLRAPGAQARTLSLGVSPGAPPADTLGFDSEGCQGF